MAAVQNAFTVDVEDWFQVSSLDGRVRREDWNHIPLRVERNVDLLLNLCNEARVQATFFCLGWLAERCPAMVRRIAEQGHEIASHGWNHRRVGELGPQLFGEDVARTKALLEDISGERVDGYRAPSFSIGPRTTWAHTVLAEKGYAYSSSVAPFVHDHYGWPGSSRFAWRPQGNCPLLEIPVSTAQFGRWRVPAGGGGFFRFYPYWLSRALLQRINDEARPAIFYIHPWEVDPAPIKLAGISPTTRFRLGVNRLSTLPRLRSLLGDLTWGSIRQIIEQERERIL